MFARRRQSAARRSMVSPGERDSASALLSCIPPESPSRRCSATCYCAKRRTFWYEHRHSIYSKAYTERSDPLILTHSFKCMLRLLLIINVVVCVVLALLVGWRGYELWLMYGGGRDADANALIDCVRKLGGLHSGLMEGGFDKAVLEYDLNARPVVRSGRAHV